MDRKQEERNSILFLGLAILFFIVVCFAALDGTAGFCSLYGDMLLNSASTTTTKAAAPTVVNINEATAYELASLPGLGETLAERIVAYRQENGPFTSADQLKQVSGIGEKKWEAILPYVTV